MSTREQKWQYSPIVNGNWSYNKIGKEQLVKEITSQTGRNKIPPYYRIKKEEETGNFHFAKDYPELKDVTEDPFRYGRIYFSDKPFTNNSSGAKTSFSSSNHIYGRLEASGKNLAEVFGIPDTKNGQKVCAIGLHMHLYFNGELITTNTVSRYLLIDDEEKNKSAINFDVKPEPGKMSSIFLLDYYGGDLVYNAPLFYLHNVGQGVNFKKNGKYVVRHIFLNNPLDAWGNEKKGQERELIADFEYDFHENDVAAIIKENDETAKMVKSVYFSVDKLPEIFSNPAKVSDAEVSYDKINAILKRDKPMITIVKLAIAQGSGPLWEVEKNDLGLPRQKWFNRKIHLVYKRDGKCYVGDVDLIKPYNGNGEYGPLQVGYISENNKLIDCAKVK